MIERSLRNAPAHRFNGGYVGHGKIESLPQPGLFARLLSRLQERNTR